MASLAFAVPSSIPLIFIHGTLKGIAFASGAGVLFGLCMGFIVKQKFKELSAQHPNINGQPVLKRVMANHIVKGESRSGQLLMSRDWLAFRAYESNFNTAPIDIPFHGIKSVETAKSMKWISNKLHITVINDLTIHFVTWDSKEWAKRIHEKCGY